MRILNVNKFYYRKGGSETYFFDLARLLEEKTNEVIPFSMNDSRNIESRFENCFVSGADYNLKEGTLKEIRKAMNVVYSKEARRKLSQMIDRNPVDLVHLHNISHQLSPSIIREVGNRGLPVVWTLHDYKIVCPAYLLFVNGVVCEKCKNGRFYNVVLRRCNRGSVLRSLTNCIEMYLHSILGTFKSVSFFVSPSRFLMNKIIEMGVDEKRVVHLPYFLRTEEYEPLYRDEGYFAYVGRLSREKGIMTLLDAARRLGKCNLKIVGGGELRDEVLEISKDIPGVELVGHLSGERLRDIWRKASFVVVPSEWYENLPYSVLESLALGKPVIGSRIGGIPELVVDGETGFLFEPGNSEELAEKIALLQERSELRQKMGRKAREKTEKELGPEAHYSRLLDIYGNAIALKKAA
ncbi:MAG: glycosyltransferase family 4 protein [Candidatus Eisenbacteria bacterium]|nr:glycosyltransferase family 4 protein [Candidatus Eisenbacteria bacterium]